MNIRKANISDEDCKLVFNLSNDYLVRKNSFNSNAIIYEEHIAWYKRSVSDKNTLFFLIFDKEEFVGQIRFTRKDKQSTSCVISLSITKQFRGKGLAKDFIFLGINEIKNNWVNTETIIAAVKKENTPSVKLFVSCGFKLISCGECNTYELRI